MSRDTLINFVASGGGSNALVTTYLLTGGTLTGLLTINQAQNQALSVQNGTIGANIYADGTFSTGKTTTE